MNWLSSFNDLMSRGGPVMWVIFFTAWLAVIMLFERAIQVHIWLSQAIKDEREIDKDASYMPSARGLRRASPASTVLHRLHWDRTQSGDGMVKQINIHLTELMPKLEGVMPTIAVLGTLLPMLGLLGTVVGMIDVFEVIALHGTGNPQEMAHGISQALLTTASGLLVAIPVIFCHHLLVKRMQYLMAITEQSLLHVYNRILCLPNIA